jgi:lysophospholipase L1-like esterase
MTATMLKGKTTTTFPSRVTAVNPIVLTKNNGSYVISLNQAYLDALVPPTTFAGLSDTPDSYAGQAGKLVAVNATESGLEYTSPATVSGPNTRSESGTFLGSNQLPVTFKRALLVTVSGGALLTATSGSFTRADVGKPIRIMVGSSVATSGGLRFAATRCSIPNSSANNKSQIMTRSGHRAWVALSQIKVGIPAVRISAPQNDLSEFAYAGTATVTASVEYPAGTFTQLKFAGVASGSALSGKILFSDLLTLGFTIPAGALFWIRIFFVNANGVYFTDNSNGGQANASYGDQSSSGTGALVDLTMSGSITNDGTFCYRPACILASSNLLSVGLVGDSMAEGVADIDEPNPFIGDLGLLAKTLANICPCVNLGLGGTTLQTSPPGGHEFWGKPGTARAQLLPFCTDLIIEVGANDLNPFVSSRTAAQLAADLQSFINTTLPSLGVVAGAHMYLTTFPPHTTSTDGFTTAANQTPVANEAERITYNNMVRAGVSGITGFFDVADVVESARNSGKWKAGYTGASDGLHPNPAGYAAISSSEVINIGINWRGTITEYLTSTKVNVLSGASPQFPSTGVEAVIGEDEPDNNFVIAGLASNASETFWTTQVQCSGFVLHSSNAASTATVSALISR